MKDWIDGNRVIKNGQIGVWPRTGRICKLTIILLSQIIWRTDLWAEVRVLVNSNFTHMVNYNTNIALKKKEEKCSPSIILFLLVLWDVPKWIVKLLNDHVIPISAWQEEEEYKYAKAVLFHGCMDTKQTSRQTENSSLHTERSPVNPTCIHLLYSCNTALSKRDGGEERDKLR